MSLESDFREIRKVSTPWTLVRTTDYRATIRTLLRASVITSQGMLENAPKSWNRANPPPSEETTSAVIWDCVLGPVSSNGTPSLGDADTPPHIVLKNAVDGLPQGAILFMVIPDNSFFENPVHIQAIANIRDEFKSNTRTLVLLGVDLKLPPFLSEDIPILDDPLPDEPEIKNMISSIIEEMEKQNDFKIPIKPKEQEQAANLCLGMTRFAVEEAVSRKLSKKGIKLDELSLLRQAVVEQSSERALTFERESWTFDQIGGLDSFKGFMRDLFNGPLTPNVVVRVDEIDKDITSASTGAVADNTGASQYILKTLLTALEDNSWMALLAVGGPGTGKTLASICTGNEYNTRTLSLDLGAVKGSLLGESEARIRRVMQILKAMGGKNVLFMATCNRLDTMPPELQRRFWLGTWFWDLPTAEEKKRIWEIQRARYGIPEAVKNVPNKAPADTDWTGSDIRNCCRMSWVCNIPLIEASQRITLAAKTSAAQIQALREFAEKSGFRSASMPGAYRQNKGEKLSRKLGMG
jgi:hypothetical protein